jgi:hypothetical protein
VQACGASVKTSMQPWMPSSFGSRQGAQLPGGALSSVVIADVPP